MKPNEQASKEPKVLTELEKAEQLIAAERTKKVNEGKDLLNKLIEDLNQKGLGLTTHTVVQGNRAQTDFIIYTTK